MTGSAIQFCIEAGKSPAVIAADIIGKLENAGFHLASDDDTGRGSGRALFVLQPTIH